MWRNKRVIFLSLILIIVLAVIKFTGLLDSDSKDKGNSEVSSQDRISKTNSTEPFNSQSEDKEVEEQKKILPVDNTTSKDQDHNTNYTSTASLNRRIEESENEVPETNILKLVAVGDILLGRGVEYHLDRLGKDYTYPFQFVADILRQGDIVFGDLEAPLTESTHGLDASGKIVLKSCEKAAEGLKYAGFNILNLANNHIMDYYEKGLLDTISVLGKNEVLYSGAGKTITEARKPAIIEKNGLKIAVISYTDMAELTFKGNPMLSFAAGEEKSGVTPRKYELIKEDMDYIRESVDILIVSLHWGVENSFNATDEQREFAYNLIDDGADIILGHHPHRFQGVEIYNDKPIIYSLGNFIFDQNDPNNQESFIVNMKITNKKLSSLELIPIRTIEKTHVVIPKGDEAIEMLKRELELCGKLGSKCAIVDDIIKFNIK